MDRATHSLLDARQRAQHAHLLALAEDLGRGGSIEMSLVVDAVETSDGARRLAGRPAIAARTTRRTLLRWIERSDRRRVVEAWRHAIAGQPFELQFTVVRPDGTRCTVQHRGVLEIGLDGGPGRGIAILRDITAQCTPGAQQVEVRRLAVEWALHHAVARGEFTLVYQPQIELWEGRIRGAEALLRWTSATLGSVSPSEFIPIAEQSGHIVAIGDWVLRRACQQVASWRDEGLPPTRVHVNVSAAQFAGGDLADRVQAILVETDVDPSLLGIEVTESVFAGDFAEAGRTLNALRALGIEISLDDFGTGYSTLAAMRALPIDVLKIDRSYVNDVTAPPEEVSLTRAVITLAHSLRMRVLAEGVETESQLALLVAHRCDAIQGFYFSPPIEPGKLAELLRGGRRLDERFFARPARQRTLLLVDDEENILASLKRLLRRNGYRIITANGAHEGLQRLAENEVDVIVSDQRMPGMTGVEFLRRTKDLYPETVRMVLSGYTELQSITDAINEGAIYKFLTKPWDDELLRANIEEAFRQKEMADENRRLEREVRRANAELAEANRRLEAALATQRETLGIAEERRRAALEVLHGAPVALVGFDSDGLIALVNEDARQLLPELAALEGCFAQDVLSEPLDTLWATGDGEERMLETGGRRFRCRSRVVEGHGGRRGRLVAIALADEPPAS